MRALWRHIPFRRCHFSPKSSRSFAVRSSSSCRQEIHSFPPKARSLISKTKGVFSPEPRRYAPWSINLDSVTQAFESSLRSPYQLKDSIPLEVHRVRSTLDGYDAAARNNDAAKGERARDAHRRSALQTLQMSTSLLDSIATLQFANSSLQ